MTVKRVRLMAEWKSWPLWDYSDEFPDNADPAAFGLPADLADDIARWDGRFQSTFVSDDPASSGFPERAAAEKFDEEGRAKCRMVFDAYHRPSGPSRQAYWFPCEGRRGAFAAQHQPSQVNRPAGAPALFRHKLERYAPTPTGHGAGVATTRQDRIL